MNGNQNEGGNMFKKLLGNKVIVRTQKEEKKEEKTESGIIIPTMPGQQKMHDVGEVVQVGPECEVVEIGDSIMYDRMAIRPLEFGGEELILLNEESVVGVL